MDQSLSWWVEAVFADWRRRPGPKYHRLAGALVDAVGRRLITVGARVPAERVLAAALGVSRGTVVACFDHLVTAGVLTRRQGAGTFVLGPPSWAGRPAERGVAGLLRADDRSVIDLSVSAPPDLRHLPAIDPAQAWTTLHGRGLDAAGLGSLRTRVAEHLTVHQGLPTEPEQLVVTSGAQEALRLLHHALTPGSADVVTTCPTYPGLVDAFGPDTRRTVPIPMGPDGPDPNALARAARTPGTLIYLMPTGHNPTGAVLPTLARQAIAAVADSRRATVVEDLSLADLYFDTAPPPPLAALSPRVVAVGSTGKLLWGGLRVGWIRADEPLRGALLTQKAALNLATSAPAQELAARLLGAIGTDWLARHRAELRRRAHHLADLVEQRLPAWSVRRPEAGLSLWVEIPVDSADAFTHTALRHGVTFAPGSVACLDGAHHRFARLSFAERSDVLDLAVDRLAAAWEVHSQNIAAGPVPAR